MQIKWVAMATVDKNSYHGILLFIVIITSCMLCKYHLHTADNSSMLSVFCEKRWVLFAKKFNDFGGRVEKYLIS